MNEKKWMVFCGLGGEDRIWRERMEKRRGLREKYGREGVGGNVGECGCEEDQAV